MTCLIKGRNVESKIEEICITHPGQRRTRKAKNAYV